MTQSEPPSVLERSAPGLFHAVRRSLPPSALEGFKALYGETAAMIGVEDPRIRREEGASFNPRPARICRILLDEFPPSVDTVSAALLTLLPAPYQLKGEPAGSTWGSLAAGARDRLGGGGQSVPLESEAIALAVVLDEVRHLHMWAPSIAAQRAAINRAGTVLSLASTLAELQRLALLVDHAIVRYRSRSNHG